MANEIHVDPAAMRRYGEGMDKCYTSLRNSLYSSKAQVDSLKGIWTGPASETFRASFQKLLDGCAQSLDIVGKMSNVVYESADAYEKSEKAVKQEAENLPKLPSNTLR